MNPADLVRLVRIGEGYHLEFKQRVSSPARIAREAIALANTWGGTILIGIEDDGSILGVKDSEEELFDLRIAFNDHCDPPIPLAFEIVPVSRKRDVIVVTVAQSDKKPHAFVDLESGQATDVFVRVDEHTIVASPEMTQLMKHRQSDEGVQFEFGEKELFLLRYLETYGSTGVDEYSRLAKISRDDASSTLVTLAKAEILQLVPSEKGDTFILNHRAHEATAS